MKSLKKTALFTQLLEKDRLYAEQNNEMILERKMKVIEEQLMAAIKNSKEIGIELEELKELLTLLYKEDT